MRLEAPKNSNYAAQVIRVSTLVDLDGLDNLVGVPTLGHMALTQRNVREGDLRIVFTAETALSPEYAGQNNLYRESERNSDPDEVGYLEKNARIRAIRLRGHTSNALLMPLSSISYTGINPSDLNEGDTFDILNGHEICKKYEIPVKNTRGNAKSKIDKAFKRVDDKIFPRHLETDQYWRSKQALRAEHEVVITQKLHGCLWRGGRVPVLRKLSRMEKIARWFGVRVDDYEYDVVFGSNRVIKDAHNPDQQHFYGHDLWTEYGQRVEDLIPEGIILYGEIIGWTKNADGEDIPIQKNYTYNQPQGQCELFVYRVAHINRQGHLTDLSWNGVKEFCAARGLQHVPEVNRIAAGMDLHRRVEEFVDYSMDKRFFEELEYPGWVPGPLPLPLSDRKTVDEGLCIRQEGIVPTILKAKSSEFLAHETKLLDAGEADMESAA